MKLVLSFALVSAVAFAPFAAVAQPFAIDALKVAQHKNDYIWRSKVSTTARYAANVAVASMAVYLAYRLLESGWLKWVNPVSTATPSPEQIADMVTKHDAAINLLKEHIPTEGFFAWCKTQAGTFGSNMVMGLASTHIITKLLKPRDAQYLFGTRMRYGRDIAVHDGNNKIVQHEGWERITHQDAHTHVPEILDRLKKVTGLMMKAHDNGDDDAYYQQLFIADQKALVHDLEEIIGFLEFKREQKAQYRSVDLDPEHLTSKANAFFSGLDTIYHDENDYNKAISYELVIEEFAKEVDLIIQGCSIADFRE